MRDTLPAVWDPDPHTIAKHRILRNYLDAWVPIMSRQAQKMRRAKRLLIVDGFAGPGVYEDGQPGSPVLEVRAVLEHSLDIPIPVDFLFVEEDAGRCDSLRSVMGPLEQEARQSKRVSKITIKRGDCAEIIAAGLDTYEQKGKPLGPAFFFLDQFGYGDVPMGLVARIMGEPTCEVLTYLNWSHMGRFLSDEAKWDAVTRAFGGNEWESVLELPNKDRPAAMLTEYESALRTRGGAKHVWHFAMADSSGKLLYWLFFCTNSLTGLREMKRAMLRVDPSGGFRFADCRAPEQLFLFSDVDDQMLADDLSRQLAGRELTVSEIEEFVLTSTRCVNFKRALGLLEKQGKLEVVNAPASRQKRSFKDTNLVVRILPSP